MSSIRQVALGVAVVCVLVATPAHATRWLLVDFHDSDAASTFGTQYPAWNTIIRHSGNTAYVDPDGNPDHEGIADSGSSPGNNITYYGIQGSSPIDFQPPHRVIATFYNQSVSTTYIHARLSFIDADSPAGATLSEPWNSMYQASGATKIPGYGTAEIVCNVTTDTTKLTPNAVPTAGQQYRINISLSAFNPNYVLTKIELSDEADVTPPNPPVNLQAAMVSTSAEAGDSVVQLTWDEPSDPGGANGVSTGVTRYYVYRDDGTGMKLKGSLTRQWVSYYGSNLEWRDYETKAGASYTYEVVAVDDAVQGWPYWPGNTNSSRNGNESSPATVAINVPSFSYGATLIDPHNDLTYLGGFRFPDISSPTKWGYAGNGLTFYPGGNPGHDPATEHPGSLYGIGFIPDSMIGELSIPKPVITTDRNQLPRATQLQDFASPWPFTQSGSNTLWAHIGYHPGGNGVGERIYYGYYRFYAGPLDEPAHGALYMDLSQTGVGAWFIGDVYGGPDHIPWSSTGRYHFQIPQAWADTYTNGRSLVVGNGGQLIAGHGGSNLTGPGLFAVAPWEGGSLPAHYGSTGADVLMEHGTATGPQNEKLDTFTYKTEHLDAIWAEAGGKRAIAVVSRLGHGDIWYGAAEAAVSGLTDYDIPSTAPTTGGGRGYHSTYGQVYLSFFNISDLERVTTGAMQPYEPRPYACIYVQDFFLATKDNRYGSVCSLAFDMANGYLYLMDGTGETGDRAMVHVWQVDGGGPGDTTAPAAVSDLATGNVTSDSVDLSWTAPGDDGSTGTASSYDVRYSTSSINEGNWASATQATGEPAPQVAGSSESFTVSGLSASTTYYFAIKTSDEVPNVSALSNVPSATTSAGSDTTPPAAVTDLATGGVTTSSVDLTWTAPGDDGSTGTATSYDVRYSTSSIDEGNWASATQATGEPAPQVAGSSESFTVSGLSASTTYYFAIKTSDEVPNTSAISNSPSATTTSGGGGGDEIAYYAFDENGGSTAGDSAGGGGDGTLVGGPTWVTGYSGSALLFDNVDDSVDVDSFGTPMDLSDPKSVAAWLYCDVAPNFDDAAFGFADATAAAAIFVKATGYVHDYGDSLVVAATQAPPVGEWYHLCYTYDGTTHRIYLNGDDVGSSTVAPEVGQCEMFRVGRQPRFGPQPMEGTIDEVKIWDRALSPAEVDALYQGAPPNAAPTVDAGSDDTITLPASATLDGTVTDDGLPDPPAAVTTTWTKFSGPGTVTFGDPNAVDTTASFSADGVYVLELEADDSALQSTDTVTITVNPEPQPTVAFDLTASNGDESVTPASLSVSLSGSYSQAVTVDYAVTGGDATGGGVDYTLAAGTLTFDPNDVSETVDITIVDDALVEADETIEVTLSNPGNATLGVNTVHTYTVNDNDVYSSVAFDLVSSSGDESVTPASLAVSLSAAYVETVTVDYAVTGGDATGGGVDYTLAAGTLTFDPNDVAETIDISIVDDGLVESDETIEVTLSNPSNASLGANTVHTYTINDNDTPSLPDVEFHLVTSSGGEATTPANIEVVLSASSASVVTVEYSVTGGTATQDVDYSLPSSPVSDVIALKRDVGLTAGGSLSAQFAALGAGDVVPTTVKDSPMWTLGNSRYYNGGVSTTASTPGPYFAVAFDVSSYAGATINLAELRLSCINGNQGMSWAVMESHDWAEGDKDYTFPGATPGVSWAHPAGTHTSTSGPLGWGATSDQFFDATGGGADVSAYTSFVSTPAGTAFVVADVTSAVQDWVDGTKPNYGLLIDRSNHVTELSEAGSAGQPVLFVDYTNTGGGQVVTFDPGVTSQMIPITITDDAETESAETIEITLSNPSNATLGTNMVHTYTINDNEVLAYWNFDENTGTTAGDSAGGGGDGTLVGGPTWVTGYSGSALLFDNVDDSVDVDTFATAMDLSDPKTIAGWLYCDVAPNFDDVAFSFADATAAAAIIVKATGYVHDYGDSLVIAASQAPPVGEWYSLCYTYDGTTHRIYLNGQDVGSSTVPSDSGQCEMFRVGRVARFGQQPMEGKIDEVKIWNRALSPAEVDALY